MVTPNLLTTLAGKLRLSESRYLSVFFSLGDLKLSGTAVFSHKLEKSVSEYRAGWPFVAFLMG